MYLLYNFFGGDYLESNNYLDIYVDLFEKFESVTNEEHDTKVLEQLNELYGNQQGQQVYEEIHGFFERIDSNYSEITKYKEKGLSADAWLKEKMQGYENNHPGITENLFNSFKKTYFGEEQTEHSNLNMNNPFDAKIISKKLFDFVKHGANIDIVATEETLNNVLRDAATSKIKTIKLVKDAFEADMGDPIDNRVKEILTVGTLKIQKKIPFKFLNELEPIQVAAVVDTAYTTVKSGYKIMTGSMKTSDAVDYLVDRGTARVEAVVHKTCVKYGTKAGAKIGGVFGGVFGPAGVALGTVIGGAVGGLVGKAVASGASKGIQKIAGAAKEKAKSFISSASSAISSFTSGVKSLIGW